MNAQTIQYVEIRKNRDGQERPFIVGTRTRVQDIVILHERFSASSDEIAERHFPHLSLAQVHAALTFFHEDRGSIWKCIREDEEYAESVRQELTGTTQGQQQVGEDAANATISP